MTRRRPEGAFSAGDAGPRPLERMSVTAFDGRFPRVEPRRFVDDAPIVVDPIDCDRCIAGKHGERHDVRTFDQEPCEHVGGDTT